MWPAEARFLRNIIPVTLRRASSGIATDEEIPGLVRQRLDRVARFHGFLFRHTPEMLYRRGRSKSRASQLQIVFSRSRPQSSLSIPITSGATRPTRGRPTTCLACRGPSPPPSNRTTRPSGPRPDHTRRENCWDTIPMAGSSFSRTCNRGSGPGTQSFGTRRMFDHRPRVSGHRPASAGSFAGMLVPLAQFRDLIGHQKTTPRGTCSPAGNSPSSAV